MTRRGCYSLTERLRRALPLLFAAAALTACLPGAMTCDHREGGVADVAVGEGVEATPQLALAAYLNRNPAFKDFRRDEESIGSDTASWSFVDGLGTTVAEVQALRIDGGWAVVTWEYCRG